jgi:hypothetical protein
MNHVTGPCGHSFPPPGPCRCTEDPGPLWKPKYRRGDVLHEKDRRRGQPCKRLIIEMVGTTSYFVRHLTGYNWAEPEEVSWGFPGLEEAMELEHHKDLPELEGFLHADTVAAVQKAVEDHMAENPEAGTLALLEVVSRMRWLGHG